MGDITTWIFNVGHDAFSVSFILYSRRMGINSSLDTYFLGMERH